MRILLIRHGCSEGNEDPSKYTQKGDQKIGLTELGWMEAYYAGQFLKDYYSQNGVSEWPHIFLSPYVRTRETMRGLLEGMDGFHASSPKMRKDMRLIEKFFGAASALTHLEHEDVPPKIKKALSTLFKTIYNNDPFAARGLFGESQKDIFANIKGFIDGTLQRDISEGQDEFLIVTHGAVIQAFLATWFHLDASLKCSIRNPGNCDIIEISGEPKKWKARRIYDGEEMTAVSDDYLKGERPFGAKDLPAFPADLLKRLKAGIAP